MYLSCLVLTLIFCRQSTTRSKVANMVDVFKLDFIYSTGSAIKSNLNADNHSINKLYIKTYLRKTKYCHRH